MNESIIEWCGVYPPDRSCVIVLTKSERTHRAYFQMIDGQPQYTAFGEDITADVVSWIPADTEAAEPWHRLVRI